jgi:hypothetical protein
LHCKSLWGIGTDLPEPRPILARIKIATTTTTPSRPPATIKNRRAREEAQFLCTPRRAGLPGHHVVREIVKDRKRSGRNPVKQPLKTTEAEAIEAKKKHRAKRRKGTWTEILCENVEQPVQGLTIRRTDEPAPSPSTSKASSPWPDDALRRVSGSVRGSLGDPRAARSAITCC